MKLIVSKILFVILVPLGGGVAHAGVYLLLSLWALTGPRRAIEALTLCWLATFLNPGIYNLSSQSVVLRWLVIAAAFVSVLSTVVAKRVLPPKTVFWLLVFVGVAGMLSMSVSYAPDVSLFKLLSFAIATSAVLLGFHLTRDDNKYWFRWFMSFFSVVILVSLPLYFMDMGYTRNQVGFQGVLNHPQGLGIFLAPFLVWLVGLIVDRRLTGPLPWMGVLLVSFFLFETQSRTGMLTVVLGVGFVVLIHFYLQPGFVSRIKSWLFKLVPLFAFTLIAVVLNFTEINQLMTGFVLKGRQDSPVVEAFKASRGDLLEISLSNFREHSLTGIGYGVASNADDLNVSRDPYFGFPIGAAVEKGFSVVAALEEIGLIGCAVLLMFLWSMLKPVIFKQSHVSAASLAIGIMLVNFGEAIFFSVGGFGLLTWLLLGYASAQDIEPQI